MAYNKDRAFEAFKILREIDPVGLPIAFDELSEIQKHGLCRDHDKFHNVLVFTKINNLLDEASNLLKTIKPMPTEHKVKNPILH